MRGIGPVCAVTQTSLQSEWEDRVMGGGGKVYRAGKPSPLFHSRSIWWPIALQRPTSGLLLPVGSEYVENGAQRLSAFARSMFELPSCHCEGYPKMASEFLKHITELVWAGWRTCAVP